MRILCAHGIPACAEKGTQAFAVQPDAAIAAAVVALLSLKNMRICAYLQVESLPGNVFDKNGTLARVV
jgi:hypothetical protein